MLNIMFRFTVILFLLASCIDEKGLSIKDTQVIKITNPYEGYEDYANFLIVYGSSFKLDNSVIFPTDLSQEIENVTLGGDTLVALLPDGVQDGKITLTIDEGIAESSDIFFSAEKNTITDIASPVVNLNSVIPGIGFNTYDIIFTITDDTAVVLITRGEGGLSTGSAFGLWVSGTYKLEGITFDKDEAAISVMDIAGHVSSSNAITLDR